VLDQGSILFVSPQGVLRSSHTWLGSGAAFHGLAWAPDGARLYASVANGYVQELSFVRGRLVPGASIEVKPAGAKGNPRPGGMAITRSGDRMFVAVTDRNAVAEVDLKRS